MSRCEWPWHAPDPRRSGPCRERECYAEGRPVPPAAQIEQQQPCQRPRAPLPARRSKQCPHRLVLGPSDLAGEGERHALDALAFGNRAGSATQTVAYDDVGRRPETCTELGQDGVRQTADGDDSFGESSLAAGFLHRKRLEPGK